MNWQEFSNTKRVMSFFLSFSLSFLTLKDGIGKPGMRWVYTLVNCNTECVAIEARAGITKGHCTPTHERTVHLMCSWGTCSLQHLLSIPSSTAFHLSSLLLSASLFLSCSLSFQGAYRCLILGIKNSPQFLIVEYLMPFNFPHAPKVTLPSLPFISPFSPHSAEAYLLFLQHRFHCRRTHHHYGINCP